MLQLCIMYSFSGESVMVESSRRNPAESYLSQKSAEITGVQIRFLKAKYLDSESY